MLYVIRFDGKNSVNNEELLPDLDKLEVSTETIHLTINTVELRKNFLEASYASEFNIKILLNMLSVIITSSNGLSIYTHLSGFRPPQCISPYTVF